MKILKALSDMNFQIMIGMHKLLSVNLHIFLISDIAVRSEYADINKTEWDTQPEVLIPTIVIGII